MAIVRQLITERGWSLRGIRLAYPNSVCCGRLGPCLSMPRRTGVYWPMACAATGAAHPQRRLPRKVIQAGRDERTLLRFSRISIARCADLVRSSAYAWGPLSQVSPPRHGSARHGPTSLRTGPSAGRRRRYGRTAAAGGGGRELAIMAVPAADAGGLLSGYPAWPVRGAASARAGPAISWIWCLTMARTTSFGSGVAAVNR